MCYGRRHQAATWYCRMRHPAVTWRPLIFYQAEAWLAHISRQVMTWHIVTRHSLGRTFGP